ncbi:ABC transporter permease [Pseudonocardia sp. TRM90224]|uniref:ABC transporter permease n=1 Tax=Pseudonocardia sp. TRM90224 TaxID=2812678 RepID=UPI001E65DBFD|nr:ABC transporter permease [Pseudonocardia sp. TRM90224]
MSTALAIGPMPTSGFATLLADSWTVAKRDLVHLRRNPTAIISSIALPVMFVMLFGLVFGSAMSVPGGLDYREFLMPGMFAQSMMNGAAVTIAAVSAQRALGTLDRFRSMPMAQGAVVIGRSIADILTSCVDLLVLILCGLAVGWVTRSGVLPTLSALGLLLLLRFAMIWIGIYLGTVVSQEAAAGTWMLLFPLTMVANTFVTPSQMPVWLGTIADWNPLSATVAATRELFGNAGPALSSGSWPAENAMLLAVAWPLLLVAIFMPLAIRRYRKG